MSQPRDMFHVRDDGMWENEEGLVLTKDEWCMTVFYATKALQRGDDPHDAVDEYLASRVRH